jgi:hypothetical protein
VIAEAVPGFERVHMARMSPDNPAGQMRCPGPADCVRRPEWTDYGEVDPVVILAALHDLPSRPPVPDERARALLRRAADVPGDHTPAAQVDAYARHVMAVVPPPVAVGVNDLCIADRERFDTPMQSNGTYRGWVLIGSPRGGGLAGIPAGRDRGGC